MQTNPRWIEQIETPVVTLWAHWEPAGLWALSFDACDVSSEPATRKVTAWSQQLNRELVGYFSGDAAYFSIPLVQRGTPFQQRVWSALREIPFGQTWSYRQLAEHLGDANAVRAVGRSNGLNPWPIIVPCHRVIGADGSLTGYAGGLDIKRKLLEHEDALPSSLFAGTLLARDA